MKRSGVILVLLAVLRLSSTSYGYILVYKLSTTVKAVDTRTGVDAPEVIKLKGFLIIDYNETELDINDADVVMYGKDQDDTLACFRMDIEEDMALNWTVFTLNAWVGFRQGGNRSGIEVLLTGKTKTKDIGVDEDKLIPGTLKGTLMVWDEIFLDPQNWYELKGSGPVTAPLNSGLTKEANENSYSSNTLADAILADLVADGYADVTGIPPP